MRRGRRRWGQRLMKQTVPHPPSAQTGTSSTSDIPRSLAGVRVLLLSSSSAAGGGTTCSVSCCGLTFRPFMSFFVSFLVFLSFLPFSSKAARSEAFGIAPRRASNRLETAPTARDARTLAEQSPAGQRAVLPSTFRLTPRAMFKGRSPYLPRGSTPAARKVLLGLKVVAQALDAAEAPRDGPSHP